MLGFPAGGRRSGSRPSPRHVGVSLDLQGHVAHLAGSAPTAARAPRGGFLAVEDGLHHRRLEEFSRWEIGGQPRPAGCASSSRTPQGAHVSKGRGRWRRSGRRTATVPSRSQAPSAASSSPPRPMSTIAIGSSSAASGDSERGGAWCPAPRRIRESGQVLRFVHRDGERGLNFVGSARVGHRVGDGPGTAIHTVGKVRHIAVQPTRRRDERQLIGVVTVT